MSANMAKLHLNIVSPEKEIFDGDVDYVKVPGTLCPFEIFPEHAPIISSLAAGNLIYSVNGKEATVVVESGFLELDSKGVITACLS
jgi:F-type H+-transporting ATPase subunit epsilon